MGIKAALMVTCGLFVLLSPALAGPITEKLRACLSIDDMTKERLDCYDTIVPPEPKPKPPKAKIITDCRFLKEEDERLLCFNKFLESAALPAATHKPLPHAVTGISRDLTAIRPTYVRHGRGGCGSRGGAGYRLPSGRCASRRH